MPGNKSNDTSTVTHENIFKQQPTAVNYLRVLLDAVMLVLLVVLVANIDKNKDDETMSMRVHEVPVFLKTELDIGKLWKQASMTGTDAAKLAAFKAATSGACVDIAAHPMCTCVASIDTDTLALAKSCLLKNPIPSKYSDWNIVAIAPALFLWFIASFATSVGTLPFVNMYVTTDWGIASKEQIIKWSRGVVVMYMVLVACAIGIPILVTAVLFQGGVNNWGGLLNMFMWSGIAVIFLTIYNFQTIWDYLSWAKESNSTSIQDVTQNSHTRNTSINNWILYVHLLIAAPAIALVVHLTQNWAEYHTVVNTTLVLSTIFAVDAFSSEMANYWSHVSTCVRADPRPDKEGELFDNTPAVDALHLQLGLVRFFAWVVNAVLFLLLCTLAYPVDVAGGDEKNAIFLVVVTVFGAAFLVPDLLREFTSLVGFNNIQFRAFGDLIVRLATLCFILRMSTRPLVVV